MKNGRSQKMQYAAKPGAHLNKSDAQIVGEAMETLRKKLRRRSFTIPEFERFCSNNHHPVHQVWRRVRDSITKRAGREAAAYLLRSVVVIMYGEVAGEASPRPVVTIGPPEPNKTVVFLAGDVAADPNLLVEYENQLKNHIRGHMQEFANIAGNSRLTQAVLSVLSEFPVEPSPTTGTRPLRKVSTAQEDASITTHATT